MMNEQEEFANFTAQQMQEDGKGGEDELAKTTRNEKGPSESVDGQSY